MGVTPEMKYAELRQKLKAKYREKMKRQEKGIPTSQKPSLTLDQRKPCSFRRVVAVDRRFMVEKIRESRDYLFLFSDDPVKPTTNITAFRKTNNNAGRDDSPNIKKPVFSIKIKVLNKIVAPKELANQSGGVHVKEKHLGSVRSLEPKKQNLEPKKRLRSCSRSDEEEEGEEALRIIRKMYNTQRFAGREDRDIAMETKYGDLLKEERKSAKIGRAEDREQLRQITEEERREKSRKQRKISH